MSGKELLFACTKQPGFLGTPGSWAPSAQPGPAWQGRLTAGEWDGQGGRQRGENGLAGLTDERPGVLGPGAVRSMALPFG